jgi:DNA-binding SARP family transcriptional activator
MQNQLSAQLVDMQPLRVAGHTEDTNSITPDHDAGNGHNTEKPSECNQATSGSPQALVGLVQHAYLRLLAGDTADARRTLERVLASEGCSSYPVVTASTVRMQFDSRRGYNRADSTAPIRPQGATGAPPVIIKTLGTFELFVDGEIASGNRKPPHLLLRMLKVLIANGGCSVSRSLLLDTLWPDLDGDRANDAQQVALHRLRRLLSYPDALVINRGYISINAQVVEVDAFVMDTLCRNPFIATHQERANTALRLYRGAFLPDELGSPWSQRMRECMRAKFVNIIATAGKELESIFDFAAAAELYEEAMTVDDLDNIIHDGLLRVLRKEKSGKRRRKPKATVSAML